ncbi:MAG: glycosyltransferase family 2 protein [Hyphomicrobium sp.]|uniref:glycosyltransferase family 2 protein n=1 Tax=Hyphomicrobium sp. TaxID=82 RepID=UPI0039E641B1
MTALPLSCFIIAKNEADRIARTIRSVRPWVDEVVVVDSESTDDTVRVAASEGCRVVTQAWLGFGQQKRFAEDQCRNSWVLNLDADEVVTPALRDEIIALFAGDGPAEVGYCMPLELVYPGADQPRLWARDHRYVRLYDKRAVRFRDSCVHDTVVTGNFPIGSLQAPAYHYSFRSYDDLKQKLAERMALYAKHARCSSQTKLLARLVVERPMNLFKYYVVRRHFTGGLKGLKYSWIQASFRHEKVAHMWRARNSGVASTASPAPHPQPHGTAERQGGAAAIGSEFGLFPKAPPTGEIYAERA